MNDKDSLPIDDSVIQESSIPISIQVSGGKILGFPPKHRHSAVEFQFIQKGTGRYFVDDRIYEFKRNSVIFIPNKAVHCFIPNAESSMKKSMLMFLPSLLSGRTHSLDILESLSNYRHILLTETESTFASLLIDRICDEYTTRKEYWLNAILSDIECLLVMLYRAKDRETTPGNSLIEKILHYLNEHYSEKLLLEDIATEFGISTCHLSREFSKYAGLGIKAYIIHRRIACAKELLEDTNLKIINVAHKVGFDDLSTFNNDFKTITGLSPSQYRKLTSSSQV